jgi:mannose-6-phosphate isomerase-like protein (cupin superfamily)
MRSSKTTHEEGKQYMAEYDATAPNARRYPRVINRSEIDAMPRLHFNTGIETSIFLSRERDDARYFRQGICYQEPDHLPYNWKQPDFDETHYVLKGKIRLRVKDAANREVVLEAAPGEHIYLPAGYEYTLEATGVETEFFWSSGPSPRAGLAPDLPEFSAQLTALRN